MIRLEKNRVYYGHSNADMINRVLGTSWSKYYKCTVDLDRYGAEGVIAWFVFMDGSKHGYEDGWMWKNYLLNGGERIYEYNVSTSDKQLKKVQSEIGFRPYRLAFMLDPFETDNRYACRYLGGYALEGFCDRGLTATVYKRVADDFRLGDMGGCALDDKYTLNAAMEKYRTPLDAMSLSPSAVAKLKPYCSCAGDLLEIGLGENALSDEIRAALYDLFVIKNASDNN